MGRLRLFHEGWSYFHLVVFENRVHLRSYYKRNKVGFELERFTRDLKWQSNQIGRIFEAVADVLRSKFHWFWLHHRSTEFTMVESIFGGKTSYPLNCHERNVFQPRLTERRLSVQSTHLNTISETGDECPPSTYATNVEENTANDAPIFYRRPRTMSLPAIYRDGSYLRIKRCSNALSPCKRRYSEPGGIATQHIIHRLSLLSSDSSESENGFCKRTSVKSTEARYSVRESCLADVVTPRRHSDPMCYTRENVDRSGVSRERRGKSTGKESITCLKTKNLSDCVKSKTRIDNEQTGQPVRRRKSSLVPVPFHSTQHKTKEAQSKVSNSRPLSFPPSEKIYNRRSSLPCLNRQSEAAKGSATTAVNANEYLVNEELQELDSDESKEDKYTANADILVQWMKFFGWSFEMLYTQCRETKQSLILTNDNKWFLVFLFLNHSFKWESTEDDELFVL